MTNANTLTGPDFMTDSQRACRGREFAAALVDAAGAVNPRVPIGGDVFGDGFKSSPLREEKV